MTAFLLASALLLLSADFELAEDPVVVPMTHATKHATVWVHVNGSGPYLFQVDTYSSGEASVDQDLVEALGLPKTGTVLSSDGQTTVRKDEVGIDELQLGGATFSGLTATVNDYSWVDRPDGKKVYGILGFASYRELTLTFDYPGNRLLFSRQQLTAEDPHTIPFSVADSGSPDIHLELAGRELVFGIDTGNKAHLSLESSLAKGFPLYGTPEKVGELRTHHNSFPFYRTTLDGTFDLAGHPVASIELQLIDGWGRSLVGYGLLRSYAVSFDQRSGLVRFSKPPLPEPVSLSDSELQRWVGTFADGARRHSIERDGDALFYRVGELPRIATIPLGPEMLRLESEPSRLTLRKNWFGREYLVIQEHPERPVHEFRRVKD